MTIPFVLYLSIIIYLVSLTLPIGGFCSTPRCILCLNISTVIPFFEIGCIICKSSTKIIPTPSPTFIGSFLRPQGENPDWGYFWWDLATAWPPRTKYLPRIAGAPRNDSDQDEASGRRDHGGWIRRHPVEFFLVFIVFSNSGFLFRCISTLSPQVLL